jgi:hypothetical protein
VGALPEIRQRALNAHASWSTGLETNPEAGNSIPTGIARPSFSPPTLRLSACPTLRSNAPLALDPVAGNDAKLLLVEAADHPAALRSDNRGAGGLTQPHPVAPTLPAIPDGGMPARPDWSDLPETAAAQGNAIPTGIARPSFSPPTLRLSACPTLRSNVPPALDPAAGSDAKLLPVEVADRLATLCSDSRGAGRLTHSHPVAPTLPAVPDGGMPARPDWSDLPETAAAQGNPIPTGIARPSFSPPPLRLPACPTLRSKVPLALDPTCGSDSKRLSVEAVDRPSAARHTAPSRQPQLAAPKLPGIPHAAIRRQTDWSDLPETAPAQGNAIPAGIARPSFSPPTLRLPAHPTLRSSVPPALDPAAGSDAKLLPVEVADRPSRPLHNDRAAAPLTQSHPAPPALPTIPDSAVAAQTDWSDLPETAPALGNPILAGIARPSFSPPTLRLPARPALQSNLPLALDPAAGNDTKHLPVEAVDRPSTPRHDDRNAAPSARPQRSEPVLSGIPHAAMGVQSEWDDRLEADPVSGQPCPVGAVAPSFSRAAIRPPFRFDLEPLEDAEILQKPPREAALIPLDYYCARLTSTPAPMLDWIWRSPACAMQPFGLQPAGEKLEALTLVKEPAASFFPPAKKQTTKRDRRIMELAAAGVLLAILSGFGLRFAARIGTETPDVKREAVAVTPSAAKSGGALAKVRRAIAARAAVELSDAFRGGMAAWGQAARWAPGWTNHPEGYVQTGQLALFEPSMRFTDYRMEFFGQIESKSIGWVVRAQDRKNYYAMKFTVIQSGLRPIIAMVHYPVTDGHPGRPIETPLMDVMVHNGAPYHVLVAVEGNRIITSIEGQEVDRWIEDQIPAGGVGFYSDAGERARLYWMKVSKNEDFLGKVCAYLSGSADASRVFALLSPPDLSAQGWNYGNGNVNTNAKGR